MTVFGPRETEVLRLVIAGWSDKEIAATLGIIVLSFQEGWLSGALDYTGPDAVEVTTLVFLFAAACLIAECGLPPKRSEQSQSQTVQERYEAYTQEAIDIQVFGAPSYVIDGEKAFITSTKTSSAAVYVSSSKGSTPSATSSTMHASRAWSGCRSVT